MVRTGAARYEFRQLPLNAQSEFGAEAAECAADQGAYWQFFDAYMLQRPPLPPEGYTHLYSREGALWLAEAHGLDSEQFAECLDSRAHRDAIERQARQSLFEIHRADPSGFRLIPTILVDGQLVAHTADAVIEAVQARIAAWLID